MENWIAIFKAGTHTDSAGHTRTFTEADLDKIVASYNPLEHEAPVTIGHPKGTAPAWAWVKALKRKGNMLYMQMKDVVPEFREMLKKRMFKKRSVALNSDLSLNHVAFLGAMPPAVKGLPDYEFGGEIPPVIEFAEQEKFESLARIMRRMRDFLIEKFGLETADQVIREWDIEDLSAAEDGRFSAPYPPLKNEVNAMAKYEDLEARLEAEKKAREKLEKELAAEREKHQRAELSQFCEKLVEEGKLPPASKEKALFFLEALGKSGSMEFSEKEEDGSEKKTDAQTLFKQFLEELPRVIEFGEFAKKGKNFEGSAREKLERLIQEKMEKKQLDYTTAFAEVQRENPELAKSYLSEL